MQETKNNFRDQKANGKFGLIFLDEEDASKQQQDSGNSSGADLMNSQAEESEVIDNGGGNQLPGNRRCQHGSNADFGNEKDNGGNKYCTQHAAHK